MKIEIKLDENCTEPKILICTNEMTAEVLELMQRLNTVHKAALVGVLNDKMEIIDPYEIVRVYTEKQKIFAETEDKKYQIKMRLYEIEKMLDGNFFVRISNSEIVNFKKIKNIDLNFAGTICVSFKNGSNSFVSRRYVSKIKEFLGI